VDEAQDLSWLQWQVVAHLAKGTRRQIIAGDDDQAIYRWAGAAVEHFIDLPGDIKVLDHSWRVPREVQAVAFDVLSRISKRREKAWNPRDGQGYVSVAKRLEDSGLDVNEDTLILSRNSCFLRDDAMKFLKSEGILYEYHGQTSVRQSLVDAIVDWEKLRKGGEISVAQAENVYAQMEARKGFEWGQKKLPAYEDRDQMVSLQDLKEAGGLKVDTVWHEALSRAKPEERQYMQAALRGGQRLTERPKIRVSTIHGAKGAQADHVILLRDMAWRTFTEMKNNPEDEARTWYVAATRAKQRLTVVKPQANINRAYEI